MNKFQVDDVVMAFGNTGVVTESSGRSICVQFGDTKLTESFHPDGRLNRWHKEPALTLVSRPAKTEPAPLWLVVSPRRALGVITVVAYNSEEAARADASHEEHVQLVTLKVPVNA